MSTRSLLAGSHRTAVPDPIDVAMPSSAPAAEPPPRRRPAVVVAGSLLAGLAAAVALVAGPLAGGREAVITGGLLLGFAAGWGLLAVLSARFPDRPQRWAAVPAAAMGITATGLIALAPGASTLSALGWVWPPLLLVLVTWMILRARRRPASRLQPWLLYPIFAALALTAIGGGYATLRDATDQPVAHVRKPPDRRRWRAPAVHALRRLGRPDRHPRTRARRVGASDGALDCPPRRPHHHRPCLRPP